MPQPSPGLIVLPSDVEVAVRDTMRHWLPFYLAEIDEQQDRERGTTTIPRTWDVASDNDTRWLDETPPALLVVCPGTVDDPSLYGDAAAYGAWWQVNIGVTASGATEAGSRALAGRLAGAVTYTIAQQGDMGGLAERSRWRGVRTNVVARQRSVMAAEVLAHVYVRNVVATRGLLPRTRPTDPTDPAAPTATASGVRVRTVRTTPNP